MIVTAFPRPTRPLSPWRSFDRAFAHLAAFTPAPLATSAWASPTFGPTVSGSWVDAGYQLTVDLPGVPDEAIGVSVAGRTLTIDVAGERDGDTTSRTTWTRRLRLPQTLDAEQVTANYVNGRLTVTVGKAVQPEPRKIPVERAAQPEPAAAPNDGGTATSATE